MMISSNILSQTLQENVESLAKFIYYSEVNYLVTRHDILFDDYFISQNKFKDFVINELRDFQGFHGDGYFDLGRPHLTSSFANFVTYIIILVQFKVSELGDAIWK